MSKLNHHISSSVRKTPFLVINRHIIQPPPPLFSNMVEPGSTNVFEILSGKLFHRVAQKKRESGKVTQYLKRCAETVFLQQQKRKYDTIIFGL